jgi:DNA-binding response OmpR family regulator
MSHINPLNVLVVEDRAQDAAALRAILTPDGHEVRLAADGLAALEEAVADPPDVVLLDLDLPKLNGLAVAAAARKAVWGRRPLLVAVTGHGDDAFRDQAAEVGIDVYLVKPIDPDALRATLRVYEAHGREAARLSAPPACRLGR